jgi:hypothetical protein
LESKIKTKLELVETLTGVRLELTEEQTDALTMDELIDMAGGVPQFDAFVIADGDLIESLTPQGLERYKKTGKIDGRNCISEDDDC